MHRRFISKNTVNKMLDEYTGPLSVDVLFTICWPSMLTEIKDTCPPLPFSQLEDNKCLASNNTTMGETCSACCHIISGNH